MRETYEPSKHFRWYKIDSRASRPVEDVSPRQISVNIIVGLLKTSESSTNFG